MIFRLFFSFLEYFHSPRNPLLLRNAFTCMRWSKILMMSSSFQLTVNSEYSNPGETRR
ncbi:unnamed protein product [Brassica rapa]|uniref:Uncharacterized protein n=1 Tax=Brassica campestris TaxID=3711 RepID=A0A8D9FVW4_BRACM|nr:unnamed protein product [Brassica rapa]